MLKIKTVTNKKLTKCFGTLLIALVCSEYNVSLADDRLTPGYHNLSWEKLQEELVKAEQALKVRVSDLPNLKNDWRNFTNYVDRHENPQTDVMVARVKEHQLKILEFERKLGVTELLAALRKNRRPSSQLRKQEERIVNAVQETPEIKALNRKILQIKKQLEIEKEQSGSLEPDYRKSRKQTGLLDGDPDKHWTQKPYWKRKEQVSDNIKGIVSNNAYIWGQILKDNETAERWSDYGVPFDGIFSGWSGMSKKAIANNFKNGFMNGDLYKNPYSRIPPDPRFRFNPPLRDKGQVTRVRVESPIERATRANLNKLMENARERIRLDPQNIERIQQNHRGISSTTRNKLRELLPKNR